MPLQILTLTYPLMPLTRDACGGVEQVAFTLLHRLAARQQPLQLITIADAGSRVPGKLIPNDYKNECGLAEIRLRRRTERMLELAEPLARASDLIHLQGFNEWRPVAAWGKPTFWTLHMAFSLYPPGWLDGIPPNLKPICISSTQARLLALRLPPAETARSGGEPDWIGNGIELDRFDWRQPRSDYWLYLGRICPEKGVHNAIELAQRSQRHLILAGGVYPFPSHQEYFRQKIAPRLGPDVLWVETPPFEQKLELLARAAAVVICTEVEEPSSLTAMEAAASGAPVLALRRGALAEIIRHGESGILASDLEELAAGAKQLAGISAFSCRRQAEQNFSAAAMAENYWQLFQQATAAAKCGELSRAA